MNDLKTFSSITLIAFSLSFLFILILLPALKKLKAGQFILGYVEEHKSKGGTPTMGGLAFILALISVTLIFCGLKNKSINVILAITFSYMIVGFLDDFIKIHYKRNMGLKSYQKIIFQVSIAILGSLFAYYNGLTKIYIPFLNNTLDLGFLIIPISVIVFLATTNSVNLTDGLDGLAGSVSLLYFLFLALIIYFQKNKFNFNIDNEILCFSTCGALLAFLLFNTNKANLFMGDTGSLSLGGLIAAISLFSGNLLYIPILGIMYVVSSISVILQVIYFKKTKKRLFLMAPLHHHFQQKGFTECKIATVYTIITFLMGLISLLSI